MEGWRYKDHLPAGLVVFWLTCAQLISWFISVDYC